MGVDTAGDVQVGLNLHLATTSRLAVVAEVEYNTGEKWESRAGLDYVLSKNLELIGQWHYRSPHPASCGDQGPLLGYGRALSLHQSAQCFCGGISL